MINDLPITDSASRVDLSQYNEIRKNKFILKRALQKYDFAHIGLISTDQFLKLAKEHNIVL